MFAGMNTGSTPSLAPHHMALIPQERLVEIQKEYFTELAHLATNPEAIEVKDRRFSGKSLAFFLEQSDCCNLLAQCQTFDVFG